VDRAQRRGIDHEARVVCVRRAYRNGRVKYPKQNRGSASSRCRRIALAVLDQVAAISVCLLLLPSLSGGYFDLHNFRTDYWRPAQLAAEIKPLRRIDDLRHTFATFALLPASLPSTLPALVAKPDQGAPCPSRS
jgi:integrase